MVGVTFPYCIESFHVDDQLSYFLDKHFVILLIFEIIKQFFVLNLTSFYSEGI